MREFASTVESPSSLSRLALRLAGLRAHHRLRSGSPGKARQAPPPGICLFPRKRCFASVRACMITPSERTGQFSLMAVRMPCPGLGFRACSVDPLHRT
ncbi:hypothetical protein F7Q97_11215, partial [Klebsiella michiganensis]